MLLGEIETASGPSARNGFRASLSGFVTWAIREGLIETNPVSGTAKADQGGPRERVLTQGELATIWRNLPQGRFGDIVRLLILTGQRRNEIGGLRLSEIDFERGLIVLPPARTKNKRQHELPLSPQASAILRRLLNGDTTYKLNRNGAIGVFGVNGFPSGGWSGSKASLDRRVGLAKPWRLHDLRRTAATMMAELGVLPHIVEAILSHVSGHKAGVAGIYNRAKYIDEMRAALCKWADYVETLTTVTSTSTPIRLRA